MKVFLYERFLEYSGLRESIFFVELIVLGI